MKLASNLIQYDPSGIFLDQRGISTDDVAALAPRLARVRCEVVQQDLAPVGTGSLLSARLADAACLELPERVLDEYVDRREASQLGQILATARRLREVVDRVVVLGAGGSCRAGRALLEACCEPYFNELSRSQRGGRPRTYFVDQHLDNDAAGGLLELLTAGRSPLRLEDRWAILPISTRGDTLHTAIALRQLLSALRHFLGADADRLAELVVPVIGDSGRLFEIVQTIGCRDRYLVPLAVSEWCSAFTPAGLLPAAVLGMDVVRLLEGASAMSDHFRTASAGANAVLDFAGIGFLMEHQRQATIRVLQVCSKSLEAVGWWYEQLLCETAGDSDRGLTPITTLYPRDFHAGGREFRPSSQILLTRVVADRWRCDAWRVGPSGGEQDPLNDVADKTLPELMAAAVQAARGADRAAGRPAAEIRLPRIDEYALGQLLQMLMLATLVEQRLRNINTRSPQGAPRDDS